MSQTSFDNLISKHPESKRALRKIEDWMHAHDDVEIIYPKTLAWEIENIDPVSLTTALMLLVRAGILRRAYKVLTPSGVFTDDIFDDPTKIPPKLADRWEHYFDTAESDVVPIFQKVA